MQSAVKWKFAGTAPFGYSFTGKDHSVLHAGLCICLSLCATFLHADDVLAHAFLGYLARSIGIPAWLSLTMRILLL